jgi:hypothetical protein
MLARNRGRDDMAFRSKLDPIGPREPNRERMFNAEVLPVDPGFAFARRPETPPPQFMPYPEVLGRFPEAYKTNPSRSAPSSFESQRFPFGQISASPDDDLGRGDEDAEAGMQFPGGSKAMRSVLQDICDQYLVGGESAHNDSGATLMLRDIPYRLRVEPDLIDIIRQTCDLDHVDYIYLPMTIEGFSARSNVQTRNKGYCFIHFSVAATAQAFASAILEYAVPDTVGGKSMFTAPAKFQGLSTNLVNLLDIHSKKWRPKNGVAHIRISNGELVCVGLLPLRNLAKRRAVRAGSWPERKGQSVLMHGERQFPTHLA